MPNAAQPQPTKLTDEERRLGRLLSSVKRVVIVTHVGPDPDAIGSALGLATALRNAGKEVFVATHGKIRRDLRDLPGADMAVKDVPEKVDAVLALDCGDSARMGEYQGLLKAGVPVANIDHHDTNPGFGDINIVRPRAAATSVIIHDLLPKLGLPISKETAIALYAGILGDTDGFRNAGTNLEALEVATDLIRKGADPVAGADRVFNSVSPSYLKLEALATAAIETERGGKLAWTAVSQSMLRRSGEKVCYVGALSSQLQRLNAECSIVFFEVDAQRTIISVRTRGTLDAGALCASLGGGGHVGAAGADIHKPMAVACRLVLDSARRLMDAQGTPQAPGRGAPPRHLN